MKALIIENDQLTIENVALAFKFRWPDIIIQSAAIAIESIELVEMEGPDIVILDLDIPDLDGMSVLQEIRLFSDVPIILLSKSAESTHIIKGLELGADDYVIKPYEPGILIARATSLLRRVTTPKSRVNKERLAYGNLIINPATHEAIYEGKSVHLSPTEWRLFHCLIRNAGRTIPYAELWEKAWGSLYYGDTSTIRTCIWRIKAKLGDSNEYPKLIIGEYGIGYRFSVPT